MMFLKDYNFHESTVLSFQINASSLELKLELPHAIEGHNHVTILIKKLEKIVANGKSFDDILMEEKDGEILSISRNESGLKIIIEWNNFKERKSFVKIYEVHGEGIEFITN